MTAPAQKITPFLMFTGAAEEAMTFYTTFTPSVSLFVRCDSTDEQERLWKASRTAARR
ncbi:MAG: 3-demethylubiquinone-9 3-methyltransferase [Pseudonocardiales bacterium]|jgi:predicted 3-demethylubiquinone-9 3-methyltransferase (glyoxalase superfamily)|nr:3-demethylubiquinone-9 3-methyltransferase [Pseudonocardiales bacterium]